MSTEVDNTSVLAQMQQMIDSIDMNGNDYDSEDYEYDSDDSSSYDALSAQQQWEESVKQITGLVNMVIFPLIGKLLGRRMAHVIWGRFANWWFL
ncbi:mitochondrial import protein 2 [[Candida] anglica]|uniref:Mitochondrial import protein 2 n=1 Tax=[Candida] anglica TaxID=148631 RepID=A0ABP0EEZ6_9ASCO